MPSAQVVLDAFSKELGYPELDDGILGFVCYKAARRESGGLIRKPWAHIRAAVRNFFDLPQAYQESLLEIHSLRSMFQARS